MLPKSLKIVVEILKSLILILVKSDRELDFLVNLIIKSPYDLWKVTLNLEKRPISISKVSPITTKVSLDHKQLGQKITRPLVTHSNP